MLRPGDWVVFKSLPSWASDLPPESQAILTFCVGHQFRVEEITDDGHVVLDVSAEVDARFGGYKNDIRVEPVYLERVSAPARFRLLPGLPATGPVPVQFSNTGQGTHREGIVVEFEASDGTSWVGNFQPGLVRGHSQVVRHPDGKSLVVVAGGTAYVVDPESRALVGSFGAQIDTVILDQDRHQLIIGNGLWFEALGASGLIWRSRRLSWDGVRNVRISDAHLRGEAWNPVDDGWSEFRLDLQSGRVVGGSYDGPD